MHAEQELLTIPEHLSPPRVQWSLCCQIFCFLDDCLTLFAIVLFIRFRFIAPDTPFGNLKSQRHRYNQETLTPFGNTRHRTKTKGQSRMDHQETLTPFGYTRHRTKTKGQSRDTDIIWVHKTQDEDAWTIKNGQLRDTDTIGYTRHRAKTKGQSRI